MGKFKLLVAGFAIAATGVMGAQAVTGGVTEGGAAIGANVWCC